MPPEASSKDRGILSSRPWEVRDKAVNLAPTWSRQQTRDSSGWPELRIPRRSRRWRRGRNRSRPGQTEHGDSAHGMEDPIRKRVRNMLQPEERREPRKPGRMAHCDSRHVGGTEAHVCPPCGDGKVQQGKLPTFPRKTDSPRSDRCGHHHDPVGRNIPTSLTCTGEANRLGGRPGPDQVLPRRLKILGEVLNQRL